MTASDPETVRALRWNLLPRWVVLGGILVVFGWMKAQYDPAPIGHHRADGTFYYQIAQHVAAGDGLRTSVSLYNQGLRDMPSPTTIYPLWPLVLGHVGRWIGLLRASWLIPESLYLVDLALLWALAGSLAGRAGVLVSLRGIAIVDVGHLLVAILGSNVAFFRYTSVPWTEALAFALLFGSLLAVARVHRSPVLWGAVAGALAGLAFLTRSQLIGLGPGVATALALSSLHAPRLRAAAAIAIAASALVVAPWLVFLETSIEGFHPRVITNFAAHRETPGLRSEVSAPPSLVRPTYESTGAWLESRLRGVVYSFRPDRAQSYVQSFGLSVYAVPLALVVALVRRLRRPRDAPPAAGSGILPLAVAFAAVLCLLPTHLVEGSPPLRWYFHHRHGLPMILGITLAATSLLGAGFLPRAVSLLLLTATLLVAPPHPLGRRWWKAIPSPEFRELLAWIDERETPPVLAGSTCRELAVWTRATTHWIHCDDDPEQVDSLFTHIPIDYLVLQSGERKRCRVYADGLEAFETVARFGPPEAPVEVLRFRAAAGP